MRSLLDDPATFKSIYRYAFDFAKVSWICVHDAVMLKENKKVWCGALCLLVAGEGPAQYGHGDGAPHARASARQTLEPLPSLPPVFGGG